MTFFYIGNDNQNDIRRCHESRDHQDPITVTGLAIESQMKDFTRIVQTVDLDPERPDGKRWRVIIREIKPPTLRAKTASGSPAQ
jgi:hypothetical protein